MELPSERVKRMVGGSSVWTDEDSRCPVHDCNLITNGRYIWCPECLKACDEKERNYFKTITGHGNSPLAVSAAIARREYEMKQQKKRTGE